MRASKRILLTVLVTSRALLMLHPASAQQSLKPVQNIIFMLSDGTSWPTLSLARWYQRYLDPAKTQLAIDPFIQGSVITYCSDAPIGDSAPTMSCYMTGIPSKTKFISSYPPTAGKSDLIAIDSTAAYRPAITLPEVARLELGKRIGVVVTSQYPHATPASTSAHYHKRSAYDILAKQMAHNGIEVLIGGGTKYLRSDDESYLKTQGVEVIKNDLAALRASQSPKLWALFNEVALPYDIDRDTSRYPSLAESTKIALQKLSAEDHPFFLMVEGSQVDWAAHANDLVALTHEMLAFDKACEVALNFAKKHGNTLVIITSDHGNSGLSIGKGSWPKYDRYSAEELFGQLARFKRSAQSFSIVLQQTPPSQLDSLFTADCGFTLSDRERNELLSLKSYPYATHVKKNAQKEEKRLSEWVCELFTSHTPCDFTTHGHTGEEVFLANYNPVNGELHGVKQNYELHDWLLSQIGVTPERNHELEKEYYTPHSELFADCKVEVEFPTKEKDDYPTLVVRKGRKVMRIQAYRNHYTIGQESFSLPTPAIYQPQTKEFYLPRSLGEWYK